MDHQDGGGAHRAFCKPRLVVTVAWLVSWCFQNAATQVPAECGTLKSGSEKETCRGFYNGANGGFTTTCGDGYLRGGGCEVGVASAFARHDADGDGAINTQEAIEFFAEVQIEASKMGATFVRVDSNYNGKMTVEEWKHADNINPQLGIRVITAGGLDKSFVMESADFGEAFRDAVGKTYHYPLAVANPIQGCSALQGGSIYQDRAVLLHRGGCEFCMKAKAAQAAGAKAAIVANTDETVMHMTVGTCGGDVTIPAIMVPMSVGTELEALGPAEVYFPACLQGGSIVPGYGLETCDDGNIISGDGCSSKCMIECGNNVINGHETCDDGNLQDGDGCSSACSLEHGFINCSQAGCSTKCGDGIAVAGRGGCESTASLAFHRYDANGDGELDVEEIKPLFRAVEVADKNATQKFTELDTDKNHKISSVEWEKAGNQQPRLEVKIILFDRTVEFRPMESANFGPDFRHLQTVYSGIIETANPIEACTALTGHYTDKIVLAKRGVCEFCIKAKFAQEAGAKAILIANTDETVVHMTPGACGAQVHIPSIMVPHLLGEEFQQERYKASTVIFPVCPSKSSLKPGFVDEECDDGNTVSGDGCSPFCRCEGGVCRTTTTSSLPTTTTTPYPTTSSTPYPASSTSSTPAASTSSTPTPTTSYTTTSSTPYATSSTSSTPAASTSSTPAPTSGLTPYPTESTSSTAGAGAASSTPAPTASDSTPYPMGSTSSTSGAGEETKTAEGIIGSEGSTPAASASSTPVPETSGSTPYPAGNSSSTEGAYPLLRNLRIVLDLPYTPREFDARKQEQCKSAVAIAAETSPDKVTINNITYISARRKLLAAAVRVDLSITTASVHEASAMASRLTRSRLNAALSRAGLEQVMAMECSPMYSQSGCGAEGGTTTTLQIYLSTAPRENSSPVIITPLPLPPPGSSLQQLFSKHFIVITVATLTGTTSGAVILLIVLLFRLRRTQAPDTLALDTSCSKVQGGSSEDDQGQDRGPRNDTPENRSQNSEAQARGATRGEEVAESIALMREDVAAIQRRLAALKGEARSLDAPIVEIAHEASALGAASTLPAGSHSQPTYVEGLLPDKNRHMGPWQEIQDLGHKDSDDLLEQVHAEIKLGAMVTLAIVTADEHAARNACYPPKVEQVLEWLLLEFMQEIIKQVVLEVMIVERNTSSADSKRHAALKKYQLVSAACRKQGHSSGAHDPQDVQILGAFSLATRNRKNTDGIPSITPATARSRDRVQFSHRALQNYGIPESQPAQASKRLSPPEVVKLDSPSTTSPTKSISSPSDRTFYLPPESSGTPESQNPPYLFTAEGVTLTLAEDYLTVKNREGTWRHGLARDVCAALRCNPSRFQYVGIRSGSILASFNLLPVAPGDADKRTARDLASELALQVYDVSSPLRTSPTTAKAIDVTLHPPAQALQRLSPPQVVKLGPTQHSPSTTSPTKSISSSSNSTFSLLTEKLDRSGVSPESTSRLPKELGLVSSNDERDIQSKQAPRPQQVLKPLDPVPAPKSLREQRASANTRSPQLTKQTRNQQDLPARDDGELEYLARKPGKSHYSPSPKRPILETQQLNPLTSPKPTGSGAVSLLTVSPESTSRLPKELVSSNDERDIQSKQAPRPQQVLKPLDPVPAPKSSREQRASANTRSPQLTKQTRNQQDLPARDDGELEYLARKPSPKRPLETQHLNPLTSIKPGSPSPLSEPAAALIASGSPEKIDTLPSTPRRRLENSPRPPPRHQSLPFKYVPVVNDRVWSVSAPETLVEKQGIITRMNTEISADAHSPQPKISCKKFDNEQAEISPRQANVNRRKARRQKREKQEMQDFILASRADQRAMAPVGTKMERANTRDHQSPQEEAILHEVSDLDWLDENCGAGSIRQTYATTPRAEAALDRSGSRKADAEERVQSEVGERTFLSKFNLESSSVAAGPARSAYHKVARHVTPAAISGDPQGRSVSTPPPVQYGPQVGLLNLETQTSGAPSLSLGWD